MDDGNIFYPANIRELDIFQFEIGNACRVYRQSNNKRKKLSSSIRLMKIKGGVKPVLWIINDHEAK